MVVASLSVMRPEEIAASHNGKGSEWGNVGGRNEARGKRIAHIEVWADNILSVRVKRPLKIRYSV